MAARFHRPPRPTRRTGRTRTGRAGRSAGLTSLPAPTPTPLAAVHVMPRPAPRPARLAVLDCEPCGLHAGPFLLPEAVQAAGTHDDLRHGGTPTVLITGDPDGRPVFVCIDETAELLRRPLPDPDTAEARRIAATLTAILAAGRSAVLIAPRPGDGPDLGGAA